MKATDSNRTETLFGVTFQKDDTAFFATIKDIHGNIVQALEKISRRANK